MDSRYCSECGHSESRIVEAAGHVDTLDKDGNANPDNICDVCGATNLDKPITSFLSYLDVVYKALFSIFVKLKILPPSIFEMDIFK